MKKDQKKNLLITKNLCSIDNVWLQRLSYLQFFTSSPNDLILSTMYSCEAVTLSCHIVSILSHLVSDNLLLYINHVGVMLLLMFHWQIISTILELYGIVSMSKKREVIDKLRGVLEFQLASMMNSNSIISIKQLLIRKLR